MSIIMILEILMGVIFIALAGITVAVARGSRTITDDELIRLINARRKNKKRRGI